MSQKLASMTGYARGSGTAHGTNFACEIKSVNARGLDVRLRLAPGLDALESGLRRRIGKAIARGSISLSLNLDAGGGGTDVVVNEQALRTVIAALDALSHRIEAQAPRLDGILGLKGVLVERDNPLSATAEAALHAAILDCADRCLADLIASRRQEGAQLAVVLRERLDEIAALTRLAEAHPSRQRGAIQERLRQQLAELAGSGTALNQERLEQEALLLAGKADIREELDRLAAHIATARKLVAEGGPVGRKLDFLSQEFNREANTLCSKSNAVELTTIGLDLKTAIDQLREQVQNIE